MRAARPIAHAPMIRGNVNWLLSAATVHEQRADNARAFLQRFLYCS